MLGPIFFFPITRRGNLHAYALRLMKLARHRIQYPQLYADYLIHNVAVHRPSAALTNEVGLFWLEQMKISQPSLSQRSALLQLVSKDKVNICDINRVGVEFSLHTPHRTVRADFPHTALPNCADFAIFAKEGEPGMTDRGRISFQMYSAFGMSFFHRTGHLCLRCFLRR